MELWDSEKCGRGGLGTEVGPLGQADQECLGVCDESSQETGVLESGNSS